MKRYWLILFINILIFVIFFTIFYSIINNKVEPNYNILSILNNSKTKFGKIIKICNEYPFVFNAFPYKNLDKMSNLFVDTLDTLINKIKISDPSIKEASILDKYNNIIISIPGYSLEKYNKEDLGELKNNYRFKILNNEILFIKTMKTIEDEIRAKLVILIEFNSFLRKKDIFNNTKYFNGKIGSLNLIYNCNSIDLNSLKDKIINNMSSIVISKDKISVYKLDNLHILYVSEINEDLKIGYIEKPLYKQNADFFLMIIFANMFLIIISFILVLLNKHVEKKTRKLGMYSSELITKISEISTLFLNC